MVIFKRTHQRIDNLEALVERQNKEIVSLKERIKILEGGNAEVNEKVDGTINVLAEELKVFKNEAIKKMDENKEKFREYLFGADE